MFINFIKPLILFIPLAAIQLVLVPLISVINITPDLIVILVVYFTLLNGQIYGTLLGFIAGFIFDLISGGLLGASMFALTVSGFVAGYFYNENKIEINTVTFLFIIILFLCGTVNSFLYSSVANDNPDFGFLRLFFEAGILPGLYTAILGLPVVIFSSKKGIE